MYHSFSEIGIIFEKINQTVPIRKVRIDAMQFSDRKEGILRPGKKLLPAKVDSEG